MARYSQNHDIKGPMWDLNLMPDLDGKVALVTGANSASGIGYHTAHQLALKGAKIYVGARSFSSAESAIKQMLITSPSLNPSHLQPFVADLADLRGVKVAAEKFLATETRLDILINNAGLLARPLDKDENGISVSMKTNHLGPFVLTTTLLPLLERTAALHPGVRVVMVSSYAHEAPPIGIRLATLDDFNAELGGTDDPASNYNRYGLSKLANLLFALQLNEIFVSRSIPAIALSVHPGGVKTAGAIRFVGKNTERLAKSLEPEDGAMTSLFAATREEIWEEHDKYGAAYLMPFGVIVESNKNARNPDLAVELWNTTEIIIRRVLEK